MSSWLRVINITIAENRKTTFIKTINIMRNFFIISLIALFPFIGVYAQNPNNGNCNNKGNCSRSEMMAKFMEKKKAYLKSCIPLNDSEAEAFFTLYNEMEKKKFEISIATFKKAREIKKAVGDISDEVYAKSADELAALSTKIATIESEYFEKIKKILTPKQMFMFFQCNHSFGKEMIKKEQQKQAE